MSHNITEELFLQKIGKCKREMNNMYWDLIRSRDNNLLWYNLVKKFRNKFSHPLIHIVAFLYKIYLIKISQLKKIIS